MSLFWQGAWNCSQWDASLPGEFDAPALFSWLCDLGWVVVEVRVGAVGNRSALWRGGLNNREKKRQGYR